MHLGEVQGDLPWGSDPKDLCSSWHRTEAQSCSPHIHCGCHSSTAAGVSGLQTSLRHTLVASNLWQSGHVENCLKLDPTSKRIGSAARCCSKAAGLWSKVEHCAMRKWHCQSWPWPLKVWEAASVAEVQSVQTSSGMWKWVKTLVPWWTSRQVANRLWSAKYYVIPSLHHATSKRRLE